MPFAQPLAAEYPLFDDALSVVKADPNIVQRILGVSLTDPTIVLLSGAFSGSTLRCIESVDSSGNIDGLKMVVSHPTLIWPGQTNDVLIQLDDDGSLILYVDYVRLAPAESRPRGLATLMLWRMVRGCEAAQIGRIELLAYGGRDTPDLHAPTNTRWGGYYAWPRLGFDGDILQSERQLFPYFPFYPKDIRAKGRVRALMTCPGGAEWWRANGASTEMEFIIGPHEESVRILREQVNG